MKCRLNHSSTPAIIFRVGASLATTIEMQRRHFVFHAAKRRRVVTSAERYDERRDHDPWWIHNPRE